MPEKSILIIEDDEVAAEILQQFVQQLRPDLKIFWCWNGFEALVQVEQINPDIIFLDYMMPKIDGLEFLKAVKNFGSPGSLKIVVISAYVDAKKHVEFKDLGAHEVLDKPIKIERISEVLDKLVPVER